jgi:hypothetical protein
MLRGKECWAKGFFEPSSALLADPIMYSPKFLDNLRFYPPLGFDMRSENDDLASN